MERDASHRIYTDILPVAIISYKCTMPDFLVVHPRLEGALAGRPTRNGGRVVVVRDGARRGPADSTSAPDCTSVIPAATGTLSFTGSGEAVVVVVPDLDRAAVTRLATVSRICRLLRVVGVTGATVVARGASVESEGIFGVRTSVVGTVEVVDTTSVPNRIKLYTALSSAIISW